MASLDLEREKKTGSTPLSAYEIKHIAASVAFHSLNFARSTLAVDPDLSETLDGSRT